MYEKVKEKNSLKYVGLKNRDDALTSVITTVAVIAIIMGFLVGPYFLIIVPEQIEQNEHAHVKNVEESFLDLRGNIYSQLDRGVSKTTTSTYLKMGTDDENLFVIGGDGELEIDPSKSLFSIHEYYDPLSIYARGSGIIKYNTRNYYYPNRAYIYEGGSVLKSQRDFSNFTAFPDLKINRREITRSVILDSDFGSFGGSGNLLEGLYLVNVYSPALTINSAKISWLGGNASLLTRLSIGGAPSEWIGSAASGVKINFTVPHVLNQGVKEMKLLFNADMLDAIITIQLFTTSSITLSDTWPNVNLDTLVNSYNGFLSAENAIKFLFRNNCPRSVTIKDIAVNWNGSATLYRINIQNHGGDVWSEPLPGSDSPKFISLTKTSMFRPNQEGVVKLYFNGDISGKNVYIRFFTENATNMANTLYPVTLNETLMNISMSALTLVTKTGIKIQTASKATKVIQATLVSAERNIYLWEKGEMLVFNFTTSYGDAWVKYLNGTLKTNNNLLWDYDGIGSFTGDYFITSEDITDEITNIKLIINSVNKLDCVIGVVRIEFS